MEDVIVPDVMPNILRIHFLTSHQIKLQDSQWPNAPIEQNGCFWKHSLCFWKVIGWTQNNEIKISQITTDRHVQIKKCREKITKILITSVIYGMSVKTLKKNLTQSAKKNSCFIINGWIKSICNRLRWCCESVDGDEQLLREKWVSILFHIQNKHSWTGSNMLFHKCCHPNIPQYREKAWLNYFLKAFVVLQNIILDKTLLSDLKHFTNFSHTRSLEVYHSTYNKKLPKSTHFSYQGMIARCQLAAIDFDLCSELSNRKQIRGKTFQCYMFKSN